MAEGLVEAPADSGAEGDSGVSVLERGVAPIKPQFLTTREHFHRFLEGKGQEKLCQETEAGDPDGKDVPEPEAKRIRLEDGQTQEAAEAGEQPQAQKRARGQNKGRPHMKPAQYDKNRLCPSLIQEPPAQCLFGDRCRFLHDVGRYLESKPPDLGARCALFEAFGRCPYGVTCRFAGAHLGPEGQNLVAEELLARRAHLPPVRNALDKALQRQLRKRQVHFERAEQALRSLSQGPAPAAAVAEPTTPEGDPGHNHRAAQLDPVGPGTGTPPSSPVRTCGPLTDEDTVRLRPCEKKRLDLSDKLYLAPLTTCGNLPFRRICKRFGADVTCGEMAMCTNLLQGQTSEWALLRRHPCEDIFGVQLEGGFPDTMTKCAELLNRTIEVDFVDINVGCPIDLVYKKVAAAGPGAQPCTRPCWLTPQFPCPGSKGTEPAGDVAGWRFGKVSLSPPRWHLWAHGAGGGGGVPGPPRSTCASHPGWGLCPHEPPRQVPADRSWHEPGAGRAADREDPHGRPGAREPGPPPAARAAGLGRRPRHARPSPPLPLRLAPAASPQLHGRSREQRYTKLADWQYIRQCVEVASPMPLFGNGDILSYEDANRAKQTGVAGIMIARGALLKPWLFTEIKEQRHWDISSSERLDILRDFTRYGLEHWGSDTQGVEKTRRFLLEWLSFLCRYVPVGLLELLPQRINERPPYYLGRDYLETLMASQQAADWIRISEMLLGPVPPNFAFLPKHKANAYK
ncbi:PREDICTED: tRNA-dihydrouridine(47) synthase [NAD(P)(+)]-like isoform X2 [Chinchilla lanigera]|uniref:tRNA-dihydrouridine(47) synthase [NAD(P)(+)]-like isoform X2 n=1 Tax=Chinchilla lanigera TaxID=34839 RepID=UPI00038EAF21|nr:PREDICTED: tRNA-dihydrouridine(47) synthase [NAD(P)(+)]-like isoform X2 [Chinchilla lanigera]